MKLKDLMKPATPPLPAKTYLAVIVGVYEVGQHFSEKFKNYNHKLIFQFDIPNAKDDEGKPRQLSKWLTPGRKKGCDFLSFFGGLDDKSYSAEEVSDIDPADYLGRACQIRVTVDAETQKNKVEAVMTLPDGIPAPKTDTPLVWYSVEEDGFEGKKWEGLPDWVRDICEKSEQYQQDPPEKNLDMPEDAAAAPANEDGGCPI
ncbi:hypothetical protein NE562_17445 [Butyricicoccus faecihominis]|uniref:phage replication initiation protein, NGO0469 family n=1 Tax=Butyricicoccus faecihominis TaxID=1712515 RepID=UPI00247897AD|nr:hypothetical protein [Butyricicoccus faecihominis]MCQ5131440.1 hypothetical protein [Butyricicoccus faecihominis]